MAKLARLRVNLSLSPSCSLFFSLSFPNSHSLIAVLTLLLNHCATFSGDQGFYTNKAPIFIFKQYFARTHTILIWNWLWLCALDISLNKYIAGLFMEWEKAGSINWKRFPSPKCSKSATTAHIAAIVCFSIISIQILIDWRR